MVENGLKQLRIVRKSHKGLSKRVWKGVALSVLEYSEEREREREREKEGGEREGGFSSRFNVLPRWDRRIVE